MNERKIWGYLIWEAEEILFHVPHLSWSVFSEAISISHDYTKSQFPQHLLENPLSTNRSIVQHTLSIHRFKQYGLLS